MDSEPDYAARALSAYAAMQRRFCGRDGVYRPRGGWHWPGAAEHLWPFARALVATLDLAGVPAITGFDAGAAIHSRLAFLERYWERRGPEAAYASDVIGWPLGGDRYYDDNAWVGLALVQLERMRPATYGLGRATQLVRFALAGWDQRNEPPSPGGVFWVEQGRGVGSTNHDRNTVSNAPNAELALHLAELGAVGEEEVAGAERMIAWVERTLLALEEPSARRGAAAGAALYRDKIRGDGTIDAALWSYNQGSMVGAHVLLDRRDASGGEHLARAEAIARLALSSWGRWEGQPPAFNAILVRNLFLLHAATSDGALRAQIIAKTREYADQVWSERRDAAGLMPSEGRRATLLDQSAMVSVFALLAWDPGDYRSLA